MKTARSLSRLFFAAFVAAGLLAPHAAAQTAPVSGQYQLAQGSGDCYAVGMQHATQEGGQLARATAEMRGNQQVCVIVVLMPAKDGQRPRRKEIVVPAG